MTPRVRDIFGGTLANCGQANGGLGLACRNSKWPAGIVKLNEAARTYIPAKAEAAKSSAL
jgi:hypothetical protein